MTTQHIVVVTPGGGLVHAEKWPEVNRAIDTLDTQCRWRVSRTLIVVATDQRDVQLWVPITPLGNRRFGAGMPSCGRVQQIAENNESRSGRTVQGDGESLEIGRRCPHRHWNLRRAKGGRFPPMQIRDEERIE